MNPTQSIRRGDWLTPNAELGPLHCPRVGSVFGVVVASWVVLIGHAAHAQTPPGPNAAESAIAGRVLASNCANCHGMDGRSAGGMPMLAGYPRDAMVATMQAFRSGQRPATIMHQLAKGYTDDQIAMVAEHFSRLKALP